MNVEEKELRAASNSSVLKGSSNHFQYISKLFQCAVADALVNKTATEGTASRTDISNPGKLESSASTRQSCSAAQDVIREQIPCRYRSRNLGRFAHSPWMDLQVYPGSWEEPSLLQWHGGVESAN